MSEELKIIEALKKCYEITKDSFDEKEISSKTTDEQKILFLDKINEIVELDKGDELEISIVTLWDEIQSEWEKKIESEESAEEESEVEESSEEVETNTKEESLKEEVEEEKIETSEEEIPKKRVCDVVGEERYNSILSNKYFSEETFDDSWAKKARKIIRSIRESHSIEARVKNVSDFEVVSNMLEGAKEIEMEQDFPEDFFEFVNEVENLLLQKKEKEDVEEVKEEVKEEVQEEKKNIAEEKIKEDGQKEFVVKEDVQEKKAEKEVDKENTLDMKEEVKEAILKTDFPEEAKVKRGNFHNRQEKIFFAIFACVVENPIISINEILSKKIMRFSSISEIETLLSQARRLYFELKDDMFI